MATSFSQNTHRVTTGHAGRAAAIAMALVAAASGGCTQHAGGWTQWGGPNRNFNVADKLPDTWPAAGPKQLWKRPLGDGYSTIVTDGPALYTMYRADKDHEAIVAIDAETGATRWEHRYAAPYLSKSEKEKQVLEFGTGPNSTPLLADGKLYAVGFTSILHCLDAATGRVIWKSDLYKDMGGSFMEFGYAASPLAYGRTIILPVGGKGQGVVALNRDDGRVVWKSTDFDASYPSPIVTTVGGRDHLVVFMAGEAAGLSPETGELHWTLPHANQWRTNICTPLVLPGERVYFGNGGDEVGGLLVKLSLRDGKVAAEQLWHNKKVKCGMSDAVLVGDRLYTALSSPENSLGAVKVADGSIAWQKRGYPRARLMVVGDRLLVLNDEGKLSLTIAEESGLKEIASAKLLEKDAWSQPTIVGKRMYLRDRKSILAVEL